MKKIFLVMSLAISCIFSLSYATYAREARGALGAEEALHYMQNTNDLVIVDVASKQWFQKEHFTGAVSIPIEDISPEEQKAQYLALPSGKPVLLHCRRGMIVPQAYETLRSLRPDITEISYIAGRPPFEEYKEWERKRQNKK